MLDSIYPAKILLVGEYTILNGSKALAVPYFNLSGQWSYDPIESEESQTSHAHLVSFLNHCSELHLDHGQLKTDIQNGLWFNSTIPSGFGLGSSGALIAAIYEKYGKRRGTLLEDKEVLGNLENHFHGSSSGIDPLVSLQQKPLLIHSFDDVEAYAQKLNLEGFFLLNTGKPRSTGPLVSIYKEKIKDPEFKRGCAEVLSREVNFTIESMLKNDRTHLFHHLWLISKFQWEYFPEMIPTQMRGPWSRGLESGDYILKLCGAGGGGFILGYSNKLETLDKEALFGGHDIRELQ